jgi:transposase InsO family protein
MHSARLSVRKQCELLTVHRSNLYYKAVEEKPENVKMMNLMDRHLLHHPTEGVESMVLWLRDQGFPVGPKRIRRLFRLMGYQSIYRRKNLTKLGLREYIKPYLLRGLSIDRPNQVWCTDITYIPMRKGFLYLTAVMDVYSRKILAWGLSNSLEASWCVQVLQSAIERYGCPHIVNSDQGSQYTSALWTQFLAGRGYRWTEKVARPITPGLSASGKASSTTMSTSTLAMMVLNFLREFKTTSSTTTKRSITLPAKSQITVLTDHSKSQLNICPKKST